MLSLIAARLVGLVHLHSSKRKRCLLKLLYIFVQNPS